MRDHHDRLVSESAANISWHAVDIAMDDMLGMVSAMDDIPLFSSAARGL
jgi:hypothetical protein